jgi:hypothetical protein
MSRHTPNQHRTYPHTNLLWHRFLVLAISGFLSGCGGLIPIGQPHPNYSPGGLMKLLIANLPELRYPKFTEFVRATNSSAPIPIAAAYITVTWGGRYLCNQRLDESCIAIAIGEEINQYPQVLEKIKILSSNPCAYLEATPPIPTDADPGDRLAKSFQRDYLIETKEYFGCEGAPKLRRNIHFLVVKNSDETLHGAHISERLEKNVISKFVITVN